MDDQMIARLLQTYGAQPSARNANAARQFFATNPEIAEKRAMGLRGSGIDDNSDIFGAQLEKFMQASEAEAPPGRVEVGPIEQVAPPQAAPAQRAAPAKMNNMPAQPGQNRQAEYGPSTATGTAGSSGDGSIWDWLLPVLIGGGAVAAGSRMKPPGEDGPAPKQKALPRAIGEDGKLLENPYPDGQKRLTYQPKLEDANKNRQAFLKEAETTRSMSDIDILRQKYGLSSEEADQLLKQNTPSTVRSDPALEAQGKKAQLQAEIDAENADAKRLQDRIMERQRAQVETKKLSDAAKRALGRR